MVSEKAELKILDPLVVGRAEDVNVPPLLLLVFEPCITMFPKRLTGARMRCVDNIEMGWEVLLELPDTTGCCANDTSRLIVWLMSRKAVVVPVLLLALLLAAVTARVTAGCDDGRFVAVKERVEGVVTAKEESFETAAA